MPSLKGLIKRLYSHHAIGRANPVIRCSKPITQKRCLITYESSIMLVEHMLSSN